MARKYLSIHPIETCLLERYEWKIHNDMKRTSKWNPEFVAQGGGLCKVSPKAIVSFGISNPKSIMDSNVYLESCHSQC